MRRQSQDCQTINALDILNKKLVLYTDLCINERIQVGNVTIILLEKTGRKAKLLIDAPKEVVIKVVKKEKPKVI